MRDFTVARLLRGVAIAGGGPAVAASVAVIATGRGRVWFSEFLAATALLAAFFAVFVWLVAYRQSRNVVVWLMAASALSAGWTVAGSGIVMTLFPGGRLEWVSTSGMPLAAPSQLPAAASWVLFLSEPLVLSAIFIPVTLGLLYFPDGRLPSRPWWIVGLLAVVSTLGSVLVAAWIWRPWSNAPPGDGAAAVASFLFLVWLVAAFLSVASLVVRLRGSAGETRQQLKWVFWGGSFFSLALVAGGLLEGSRYDDLLETFRFQGLWTGGVAVFLVSYGVAVAKYRLYDIDLFISRTVVYGTLAVSITVFYVAVVVGLGAFIGGGDEEPNPLLAIGATALVAFAFEPFRVRLQHLANRIVYGRRATPYQVLSEFSTRISAPAETLLEQVALSLVDGTTAVRAEVWLTDRGGFVRSVVSDRDEESSPPRATDLDQIPGFNLAEPIVHSGEVLGALTLTSPHGETLLPSDERLLRQLASALGLALRNGRLGQDLRRRIEELRRSRQRIVAVQDETRRRLERDLHDGAQQRLVAVRVKLGLAKRQADKGGKTHLADLCADAATKTEHAIDSLRDFARGVHPPLLDAEGIDGALASQVQRLPIPVTLHAPAVARYPPAVEAAVYFCVLEALQNMVTHANATSAYVSLHESRAGKVTFEVSEDGVGFEPREQRRRSGLVNMADRVEALDGTLEVITAPGGGTTIRGEIPVPTLEAAH